MDKPEALRLADLIQSRYGNDINDEAAAELRRLHEAHDWQYKMAGERLRRIEKLEAQRDALLKALKKADQFITNGIELGFIRMPDAETPDSAHETPGIVRAAIKAVEEGK